MASLLNFFKYKYSRHAIDLSQLESEPEPPQKKRKRHQSAPISVQFQFQFRIRKTIRYMVRPVAGPTVMVRQITKPTLTKSFTLDPRFFKFRDVMQGIVSAALSQLGIIDSMLERVTVEISSYACEIVNNVCNMGRKVFIMGIDFMDTEYFLYDERELMEEMIRDSMVEIERRGFRVVPASKTAVNDLERMEFDGGDLMTSCTVCLEEFDVGSEVTRMPCGHVFHGDCIGKWLGTSHVCPICRFEMPISELHV